MERVPREQLASSVGCARCADFVRRHGPEVVTVHGRIAELTWASYSLAAYWGVESDARAATCTECGRRYAAGPEGRGGPTLSMTLDAP